MHWRLRQDGWRVWLILVAVPTLLVVAGWRPLNKPPGYEGQSIVMHSALLGDWEVPGVVPHPDAAAATARLRAVAAAHQQTCGTAEVYRTVRPDLVGAALEGAQAHGPYLRFKDETRPTLSRWEGPQRLLVVETRNELLLCLLAWPSIG